MIHVVPQERKLRVLRLGILAVKNSMKRRLARSPWARTIAGKPSARPSDCCREKMFARKGGDKPNEPLFDRFVRQRGKNQRLWNLPLSRRALTSTTRCGGERLRRSSFQTTRVSPSRGAFIALSRPSRVCTAPLTASVKIFLQPAFLSASGDE